MPVRKIPRKYASRRGGLYSFFLNRIVERESRLENCCLTYLDYVAFIYNRTFIKQIEEQPVTINWNIGMRQKHYTPDLGVWFVSPKEKNWLCEIKPRSILKKYWATLKPILKKGFSSAKKRGMIFKIISDEEIFLPNQETLRFLRTHIEKPTDPFLAAAIIATLKHEG